MSVVSRVAGNDEDGAGHHDRVPSSVSESVAGGVYSPNISSVVSTTTLPSFERASMSRSAVSPRMA